MAPIAGRAAVTTFLCLVTACTSSSTSVTSPTATRCPVDLSLSPPTIAASGGSGQISIGVNPECTWQARSEADWIALAAPASGQGQASVAYTAAPNPVVAERRGAVIVNEQRVEVAQAAAACTFALDASGNSVGAEGGTLGLTITAQPSCVWSAASQANWIHVEGGREGNGPGTVQIRVEANEGDARRGTILVAGQRFEVVQSAARRTTPPPPAPGPPPPTPGPPPSPQPPPPPEPPRPQTLGGKIAELSGRCPNFIFKLQDRTVRTNDQTSFEGGCRRVREGREVRVTGVVQPDGSVLALRVRREDD